MRKWKRLSVHIPNKFSKEFGENELAALKDLLAEDPRPQYQHDATRIYGMPFGGKDVKI